MVRQMDLEEIYDLFLKENNDEIKTLCAGVAGSKIEKMEAIPCIYCLTFPDGKKYVGATKNFHMRIYTHRYLDNADKILQIRHTFMRSKLESHKVLYKDKGFKAEILEKITKDSSKYLERIWIDKLDAKITGLNTATGSILNIPHMIGLNEID